MKWLVVLWMIGVLALGTGVVGISMPTFHGQADGLGWCKMC